MIAYMNLIAMIVGYSVIIASLVIAAWLTSGLSIKGPFYWVKLVGFGLVWINAERSPAPARNLTIVNGGRPHRVGKWVVFLILPAWVRDLPRRAV